MSMMGELKFFLGIQINQLKDSIYSSNKVHKGASEEVQDR